MESIIENNKAKEINIKEVMLDFYVQVKKILFVGDYSLIYESFKKTTHRTTEALFFSEDFAFGDKALTLKIYNFLKDMAILEERKQTEEIKKYCSDRNIDYERYSTTYPFKKEVLRDYFKKMNWSEKVFELYVNKRTIDNLQDAMWDRIYEDHIQSLDKEFLLLIVEQQQKYIAKINEGEKHFETLEEVIEDFRTGNKKRANTVSKDYKDTYKSVIKMHDDRYKYHPAKETVDKQSGDFISETQSDMFLEELYKFDRKLDDVVFLLSRERRQFNSDGGSYHKQ